ncbi:MAG: hypothetical protein ACRC52_04440 [Aeromonas veronii]
MSYVPRPIDALTLQQLAEQINAELRRIATQDGEDFVSLKPTSVAPKKPRTGMVIYAASPWNPGSGEGVYRYSSGGTWVFLG